MVGFLITLGLAYLAGVAVVPVVNGLSPWEFPAWDWPVALLAKFWEDEDKSE